MYPNGALFFCAIRVIFHILGCSILKGDSIGKFRREMVKMMIGYVRVSTQEQNTARQEELMESLNVDKVFIDKVSGKDTKRTALNEMLSYIREGDI